MMQSRARLTGGKQSRGSLEADDSRRRRLHLKGPRQHDRRRDHCVQELLKEGLSGNGCLRGTVLALEVC